jgi:xanthine dehydrogenase accessory factor
MSVFERLAELERCGAAVAVATVIYARGSVPRHEGARMIIFPEGRVEGSVGGGEMESRVVREALEILAGGDARLVGYTYIDPARGDPGVCGGEVRVFIETLLPPQRTPVMEPGGALGTPDLSRRRKPRGPGFGICSGPGT